LLLAALVVCAPTLFAHRVRAAQLPYVCSQPPIEATFAVEGGHYSGVVSCGNLFLQPDIPTAPIVRWRGASKAKFYTLMMLDFDGNATGSWPDPVAPGKNSPVRHWIVGNIPGALLRGSGYVETEGKPGTDAIRVLQPYRSPHIPVVSDRYGIYLFEQSKKIDFKEVSGPITNFNDTAFIDTYKLGATKASNFFVVMYTSESPFSGRPFHGNDVSAVWHHGYGTGQLAPSP